MRFLKDAPKPGGKGDGKARGATLLCRFTQFTIQASQLIDLLNNRLHENSRDLPKFHQIYLDLMPCSDMFT